MLSYVSKSVVCEEDLSQKESVVFGNVELSDNEKEVLSNRPSFCKDISLKKEDILVALKEGETKARWHKMNNGY